MDDKWVVLFFDIALKCNPEIGLSMYRYLWYTFRQRAWQGQISLFRKHHVSGSGSQLFWNARTFHAHEDVNQFLETMLPTVDSVTVYRKGDPIPLFQAEAFYAFGNLPIKIPRLSFVFKEEIKKHTNSQKQWLLWMDNALSQEWYHEHGFHLGCQH